MKTLARILTQTIQPLYFNEKVFANLYPDAQTTIIDPENFVGFINIS